MNTLQLILPPAYTDVLCSRLELLCNSFERLTGRALLAGAGIVSPEVLWNAPRVIVAHGVESDPLFFYGNRLALEVFEIDFARFNGLPSRYSAEPVNREERAVLLERVRRDAYIDDYAGVRISAQGRRFQIEQAVVWNLIDAAGVCHGQAATFERWIYL